MLYRAREYCLDLTHRTHIMGIVNITPDSFSDGGQYLNPKQAISHSINLAQVGADLLDFGAESTRPGAKEISTEEQLNRLIPVLEEILPQVDIPVSVDTSNSVVAKTCLELGVHIINDVSGFKKDLNMASVVASYEAGCILMHMRGTPQDMQLRTQYSDLIEDIVTELTESIDIAKQAGIQSAQICIDPGLGFAKDADQSIELLNQLSQLKQFELPILIGSSRKSFIRKTLNTDELESLKWGTAATCAVAVQQGANIVRVHDVKEMKLFMTMLDRVRNSYVGSF